MNRFRNLIAFFGILLFAVLGLKWMNTYSLWDDEANTALFAQSVHETGDTSAIRGHNLIAFRNGSELNEEKKARYVSPLQYYVLAPFIDPAQPDPVTARLPFFIFTLASLVLIYRRLLMLQFSGPMILAFTCLSVGLVSLLLFGIQSRYYALTFFFSLLLSDQYFFSRMDKPRHFFRFGLVSALLFISNYLIGVAVLSSLLIHQLFLKKEKLRNCWTFFIPHLLISVPVFLIWNPLGKNVVEMKNSSFDKLNLLFRNVRDFNGGHLGSILLLVCGLFLSEKKVKKRFQTYALLLFTYLITISLFSPQPVRATGQADVRYLYPLMILSLSWTLDFFQVILHKNKTIFAASVFVFSFLSIPYTGELRSHALELFQELSHPALDPYALVSTELNKIQPSENFHPSVLTNIDYATYPLMFASPQFKYVQSEPTEAPDVLIDFCDGSLRGGMEAKFNAQYSEIAAITSACREAFRPEVFLRSFGRNQNPGTIRIFSKTK